MAFSWDKISTDQYGQPLGVRINQEYIDRVDMIIFLGDSSYSIELFLYYDGCMVTRSFIHVGCISLLIEVFVIAGHFSSRSTTTFIIASTHENVVSSMNSNCEV